MSIPLLYVDFMTKRWGSNDMKERVKMLGEALKDQRQLWQMLLKAC